MSATSALLTAAEPPAHQTWPDKLLTEIAAHAARTVDAEEAAICVRPTSGRGLTSVSTSRDREWLTLVSEQAMAVADASGPTQHELGGRVLAVVGLVAADRVGVLVVGRRGGEPFTDPALELLGSVARLVVAALDETSWTGAAPSAPAAVQEKPARPTGDYHHRLPKAFERLEGLPALVESRDLLLNVLDGPTPSRAAIVGAIESDVALLIAVLRLANATRPDVKPDIWSVPSAVEALTPEGVEVMARRIAVFDFFQHIRGWSVPPEQFRLHAMATQRTAERLARLVGHEHPNRLMVAALLHDVGKLVLMEAFPDYPDRVLAGAETPLEALEAERRMLGIDHQMAGGVLVRRWSLPDELAAIVSTHHSPGENRDAALVGLSDALAHYMHGDHVASEDLGRAARAAGVNAARLRTVMYELSQPDSQPQGRHPTPSPLTARETEMLTGLAGGLTNKQIALEVGLSVSTVRSHLHNVYGKLEVADRAQAVLTATANCWI